MAHEKFNEKKEQYEETIKNDANNWQAMVALGNLMTQRAKDLSKDKETTGDEIRKQQIQIQQQELNLNASEWYDKAMEIDEEAANSIQSSCIFRQPPDSKLSFREEAEEVEFTKKEEEEEDNEESGSEQDEASSSEEEFDHSEHMFQLARRQYEDILRKEPDNELIKQRLANLLASRLAEVGDQSESPTEKRKEDNKRQKIS